MTVGEDFLQLTDPLRRELLAHCYRMTGSVHDAEDLVQETYLRAWRAYDGFEGRSSVRTWLYRIATTRCLTALDQRGRRPLPTGLGSPDAEGAEPLAEALDLPWLEPVPDATVGADGRDPATVVTSRESIRLALVAALQYLPPRQRAVLILRDVLQWRAAEVAEVLDTTTTAVNSILQRARAQLAQAAPSEEALAEPDERTQRELLDRYVSAFESYDLDAIVSLFTEDAVFEMPPYPGWFRGRENIRRLTVTHCPVSGPGDLRLVPCAANGQPAFAAYLRDPEGGPHRAFAIHVLTLRPDGISRTVQFFDLALFGVFGLQETLPEAVAPQK
ncbi:sigma-70 family RNA polymerase sigma factor [Nonomuraea longicatena]|uniref:RNA polymerase sigma factor n=1 Tax=Nonomuraea longicatena TaxID=83682 RepID=A0ABP3ZGI5_9ACTN